MRDKLTTDRGHRHSAFADAEERAQIAVTRRIENDALAEFVVSNALAGLESETVHSTPHVIRRWNRPAGLPPSRA